LAESMARAARARAARARAARATVEAVLVAVAATAARTRTHRKGVLMSVSPYDGMNTIFLSRDLNNG
jgi:hypothetical protein